MQSPLSHQCTTHHCRSIQHLRHILRLLSKVFCFPGGSSIEVRLTESNRVARRPSDTPHSNPSIDGRRGKTFFGTGCSRRGASGHTTGSASFKPDISKGFDSPVSFEDVGQGRPQLDSIDEVTEAYHQATPTCPPMYQKVSSATNINRPGMLDCGKHIRCHCRFLQTKYSHLDTLVCRHPIFLSWEVC